MPVECEMNVSSRNPILDTVSKKKKKKNRKRERVHVRFDKENVDRDMQVNLW